MAFSPLRRWRRCRISLAVFALTLTAACARSGPPASVYSFGLHPDSPTGAAVVEKADTVGAIAARYRLPVRAIIDLNGLRPPYALQPGQRLKLPAPTDYRVQSRDTPQGIAALFAVSVTDLARVNRLSPPYGLTVGQVLRIPALPVSEPAPVSDAPRPATGPSVAPAPVTAVAARPLPAPAPGPAGRMGWPVRGRVVSAYGPKEGGLYNDGINIAAPAGAAVQAAADGAVAYVGNGLSGYGNLVLLRHGNGRMTAYAHLARIGVQKGMKVRRGQDIGTVGSTGAVGSPQLHFEIRDSGRPVDPSFWLG